MITAKPKAKNYVVEVTGGHMAIGLSTMKFHKDLWRAQIKRVSTGVVCWTSASYTERKAAQLQGNRQIGRWEFHLAKHGVGFEEQRAAKEAAKKLDVAFSKRIYPHKEAMYVALRLAEVALEAGEQALASQFIAEALGKIDEAG